jgi:predicted ATPase
MASHTLKAITLRNFKNLLFRDAIPLSNLNLFIGPNGSGKSNLIGVLNFLRDAVSAPIDTARGRTAFDDALFSLGGARALDKAVDRPAKMNFVFEFSPGSKPSGYRLELDILVQDAIRQAIISREILTNAQASPLYFYQCHDRVSGEGKVSIYNDETKRGSHFEDLSHVPVDELALVAIPRLLESSHFAPENTPIYKTRRELIDAVSQWRFYNANEMNLKQIRQAEPSIGPSDVFLAASGENLPLVIDNLSQANLTFEEKIDNAMRAILPATRRVRAARSRLNLTVEWHVDDARDPFYLSEMSDGTVRMLCWATILHSPMLPSLLVIEEPEIGIHVAWLPILAEWIKMAADNTQVIISTHSPDLLDHFTDRVDNAFVFDAADKSKQHFEMKQLTEAQIAPWKAQGWQLGDLYRVGDPSVGGWPW